jgi:hypothetical protein
MKANGRVALMACRGSLTHGHFEFRSCWTNLSSPSPTPRLLAGTQKWKRGPHWTGTPMCRSCWCLSVLCKAFEPIEGYRLRLEDGGPWTSSIWALTFALRLGSEEDGCDWGIDGGRGVIEGQL